MNLERATDHTPQGVWVEYPDGTRYDNLATIFHGRDENGIAMYEVIPPREDLPSSMGAALLPSMTGLRFPELEPGSETP